MKAKLYFYYGAMGSTKSAQLLTTNFNYNEKNMKTLLMTSKIDTRFSEGIIQSRIGIKAKVDLIIDKSTNILKFTVDKLSDSVVDVILVDEIQFLQPKQIDQLSDIVDILNIPVLCYGLRADFKSKFFPASKRLMEIADTISEIKTMCHCGKKATFTARVVNDKVTKKGEQVLVGGNESYISLCRKCWKLGRLK